MIKMHVLEAWRTFAMPIAHLDQHPSYQSTKSPSLDVKIKKLKTLLFKGTQGNL
jgi:hypothetical protein